MQSIEARAVAVVDVIPRVLRVLLILPHVLFLAHAFKEAPSVKDRAELMYPHGVWGCARGRIWRDGFLKFAMVCKHAKQPI